MNGKSFYRLLLIAISVLCCSIGALAQDIKVSGVILDADTDEPLIGATVVQQGKTTNGMSSDMDGRFTLTVPANATLVVSYIGYNSQKVAVDNRENITIRLSEAHNDLQEVVVIGYGVQKKADLTGAVSVVDMKEAKKTASTNLAEMLQGQVAGVSVSTTSEPGTMSKVQIRGVGSLNSVGPLYVIDGMIVNDANHINPNEIESMQVLKDASAAAIYGARAANGVIIITTKKGKNGQPSLDINANWSVSDMPRKIDMMGSTDFMRYNELAYLNNKVVWPGQAYSAQNIGHYIPNTDWQRARYQTGFTQDYSLMYTQGSEKINMAIGGGYMDQTGVVEGPSYQRFTARINTDATYGIVKVGENLTFQHTQTLGSNGGFAGSLAMPSVIPVNDPSQAGIHKGDPGFGHGNQYFPTYTTNPVGEQLTNENMGWNDRVIGNILPN